MASGKFAGRNRNPRHSWRGGCQSQNRTFWVVLREQGAPDTTIEHVSQDNTARLAELAKQLRGLKGGTAADKTIVARIANILELTPRPRP